MLKTIKVLLVLLFFIVISLGSLLYSGIKIDSFSFGNFSVEQFYLKLNKKLILKIEKIVHNSKKSAVKNSFDDIKKDIELLPKLLKFFEKIDIERLFIDGNAFTIALNDETVYLDNKFINLSSKVDFRSKQVVFDLYSLYLKDIELLLEGRVKIDYFKEKIDYYGNYTYQDINGDIKVDSTKDLVMFYLNSNSFKSLKFIKKYVDLPKVAEEWMYDNVAGDIKLEEFYGAYDLKNNEVLMNSLQGKASINKAKIKFHKNVEPVVTENVKINYDRDKLSFDLIEPKYLNTSIKGSSVVIENLTSAKNGQVLVNINANAILDKNVNKILKAYKINLPLVQKSGNTKAKLFLIVPYDLKKDMTTKGEFDVSDSKIAINDFEFYSKKGKVVLDNRDVNIINTHFKYKTLIDSIVDLKLDTTTLKAIGNVNLNSLFVADKTNKILDIKNYKTPVNLSFKNEVKIVVEKLKSEIKVDDLIYVKIDDLSKIYPYSKLLKDNEIKKGNITLNIKNEKDLSFKANIEALNYPLEKNGKKIDSFLVKGDIKNDNINISSLDGTLKIKKNKDSKIDLKLRDIDINLKNQSSNNSFDKFPSLKVNLNNSKLILKNDTYELSSAKIDLNPKKIFFNAEVINLDLPILKNKKRVKDLKVSGTYSDDLTTIETVDKKINLRLEKENISVYLDNYDLLYNSDENKKSSDIKSFDLNGKNSNIIINDKYKFLANEYEIRLRKDNTFLHLKHEKSDITFKQSKDKIVDIFANNISSKFLNSIFNKNIVEGGNFMLLAKGKLNNLDGKFIVENSTINDLAILNNLLLFIHTSPAIINPLLAIPSVVGMATNGGFDLSGYKIINGNVEFNYNKDKELLKIKKLLTVGNGIDFDGNGLINLNNMTLKSKVKLIFLKDYSKLVGAIPIVNYILLGKDKRVETQVDIFGNLENPKISTNLTKDTFSVPVNIAKRILKSPAELLDFIKSGVNKKEDETNKPNN